MSTVNSSSNDDFSEGFDSRDCINFIVDGPGDNTIRPVRPEHREQALAERERFLRLLGLTDPAQLADLPPDVGQSGEINL